MSSDPLDPQPRGHVGTGRHTVTGGPDRRAAHAARPAIGSRAALAGFAGVVAALVQHAGSVPSAPDSAQRITAPPRTSVADDTGSGRP